MPKLYLIFLFLVGCSDLGYNKSNVVRISLICGDMTVLYEDCIESDGERFLREYGGIMSLCEGVKNYIITEGCYLDHKIIKTVPKDTVIIID